MSASTSKLEMSLDDIIKAQKGKGNSNASPGKKPSGGAGAKIRRNVPINKRRQVLLKRGGGPRRSIGGGINKSRVNQGKRLNITTIGKKRIGGPIRRGVPRRQPIGGRFVRKNVPAGGNNRAMVSATKNLVKKLVKKALAKNVATTSSTIMATRQGKLVRIPANRIRQRRPIMMLNRLSARSRVIGRPQRQQRIVAVPQNRSPIILQQQPAANVRGRGPIRFATTGGGRGPIMMQQSAAARTRVITLPKRRRNINNNNNAIQYVQQQPSLQAPISFQQARQQPQLSVRGQINAMRRATRVQQLNTQFLKQQSQPAAAMFKVVRQSQQQQLVPMMNRRQQQQPTRRQQQFFTAGRRGGGQQQRQRGGPMRGVGGGQQQQVIQLDPMYVPPNYLQRI